MEKGKLVPLAAKEIVHHQQQLQRHMEAHFESRLGEELSKILAEATHRADEQIQYLDQTTGASLQESLVDVLKKSTLESGTVRS